MACMRGYDVLHFFYVKVVIKYSFLDRLCFLFFLQKYKSAAQFEIAWMDRTEGHFCLAKCSIGKYNAWGAQIAFVLFFSTWFLLSMPSTPMPYRLKIFVIYTK